MTRTIVIETKAEFDALVKEDKNFLLTNQAAIKVGDTVLLQYIEPEVLATPGNEVTATAKEAKDRDNVVAIPATDYAPAIELEHATTCTYVTSGHPIMKGYQALTLKTKGE